MNVEVAWPHSAVVDSAPTLTFEVDRDKDGYATTNCPLCHKEMRRATEHGVVMATVEHMNTHHVEKR